MATDLTPDEAKSRLADAAAVWRLQRGLVQEVIDAAVDCLIADVDSPSLRLLAGADRLESQWVLQPLVEDTLDELGLGEVRAASPQRAALTVMLRRFKAGEMSAVELARWAHTHIGHDGDIDCQPFVDLDDMYDTADYTGQSLDELNQWTMDEADAFLEGRPSPRRRDWTFSQDEPEAVICGPKRWRRRFTVRVLPGGREFTAARWDDVWASLLEMGVPWRNVSFESDDLRQQVVAAWGSHPDAPDD